EAAEMQSDAGAVDRLPTIVRGASEGRQPDVGVPVGHAKARVQIDDADFGNPQPRHCTRSRVNARAIFFHATKVNVVGFDGQPVECAPARNDLEPVVVFTAAVTVDVDFEIRLGETGADIETVVGGGGLGRDARE